MSSENIFHRFFKEENNTPIRDKLTATLDRQVAVTNAVPIYNFDTSMFNRSKPHCIIGTIEYKMYGVYLNVTPRAQPPAIHTPPDDKVMRMMKRYVGDFSTKNKEKEGVYVISPTKEYWERINTSTTSDYQINETPYPSTATTGNGNTSNDSIFDMPSLGYASSSTTTPPTTTTTTPPTTTTTTPPTTTTTTPPTTTTTTPPVGENVLNVTESMPEALFCHEILSDSDSDDVRIIEDNNNTNTAKRKGVTNHDANNNKRIKLSGFPIFDFIQQHTINDIDKTNKQPNYMFESECKQIVRINRIKLSKIAKFSTKIVFLTKTLYQPWRNKFLTFLLYRDARALNMNEIDVRQRDKLIDQGFVNIYKGLKIKSIMCIFCGVIIIFQGESIRLDVVKELHKHCVPLNLSNSVNDRRLTFGGGRSQTLFPVGTLDEKLILEFATNRFICHTLNSAICIDCGFQILIKKSIEGFVQNIHALNSPNCVRYTKKVVRPLLVPHKMIRSSMFILESYVEFFYKHNGTRMNFESIKPLVDNGIYMSSHENRLKCTECQFECKFPSVTDGVDKVLKDHRKEFPDCRHNPDISSDVSKKNRADDDDDLTSCINCIICLENKRTCTFYPCGHCVVCELCFNSPHNNDKRETCIVCRQKIQCIIKTFLS